MTQFVAHRLVTISVFVMVYVFGASTVQTLQRLFSVSLRGTAAVMPISMKRVKTGL
jgi:hypothetical protein